MCVKPLFTSLALYLYIFPPSFNFFLNTHLHVIALLSGTKSSKTKVFEFKFSIGSFFPKRCIFRRHSLLIGYWTSFHSEIIKFIPKVLFYSSYLLLLRFKMSFHFQVQARHVIKRMLWSGWSNLNRNFGYGCCFWKLFNNICLWCMKEI